MRGEKDPPFFKNSEPEFFLQREQRRKIGSRKLNFEGLTLIAVPYR